MSLNFMTKTRLSFIEAKLFWGEKLNRSDLMDHFKISRPQATNDFTLYHKLCPDMIYYDKGLKYYVTTKNFKPRFYSPSAEDYLEKLIVYSVDKEVGFPYGKDPDFFYFKNISRPHNISILKRITYAIANSKSLLVSYDSFGSDKGINKRRIAPHALVYEGYRLHTRAYCYKNNSFNDFNLGRIIEVFDEDLDSPVNSDYDYLWEGQVTFRIAPHPDLSTSQRKCIEREYEMTKGIRDIKVKASSGFYIKTHYNFDLVNHFNSVKAKHKISAVRQQVVLLNWDEIKMKEDILKEMSQSRLADLDYQSLLPESSK